MVGFPGTGRYTLQFVAAWTLRFYPLFHCFGVTMSTGLLLGLAIRNWKASPMLAASTGLASVAAALLTLVILDGLGIRVGTGNIAMPKATAAATMAAALAGGAMLGVVFTRYVSVGSSK